MMIRKIGFEKIDFFLSTFLLQGSVIYPSIRLHIRRSICKGYSKTLNHTHELNWIEWWISFCNTLLIPSLPFS